MPLWALFAKNCLFAKSSNACQGSGCFVLTKQPSPGCSARASGSLEGYGGGDAGSTKDGEAVHGLYGLSLYPSNLTFFF